MHHRETRYTGQEKFRQIFTISKWLVSIFATFINIGFFFFFFLLISTNSLRCSAVAHEEVGRVEHKIRSCSVHMPKKIAEDSLLSAGLRGLTFQSANRESSTMELRELLGPNVSQMLKSKRALQKTKQLLFDCVREITLIFPRKKEEQKGCRHLLGPEVLAKLICEKTQEWAEAEQAAGHEKNLTYLLALDYLNSPNEWSDFGPEMKDVSVGVADAILQSIVDEIVFETAGYVPPTI